MVSPTLPPIPILLPSRPYRDRVRSDFFLPYTENETQAFLEDMSDIDRTYMLWDKKSGLAGLLRARMLEVVQQARRLVDVYFDFTQGRYRYLRSGRLVPINQVRMGALRVAKSQEIAMRDLTQSLVNGEISEQYWYNTMREMMKQQYRASYIASIGGIENYTRSEIAKFGWQVRPQYRWLDNFLAEIQSGKQPLNARAVFRAGMYARAGNGIYQNNIFRIAEQNGKKLARRVLGETDNHCHDRLDRPGCVELAALGYVPFAQAVPIGDAACYSHCLCSWRFR